MERCYFFVAFLALFFILIHCCSEEWRLLLQNMLKPEQDDRHAEKSKNIELEKDFSLKLLFLNFYVRLMTFVCC